MILAYTIPGIDLYSGKRVGIYGRKSKNAISFWQFKTWIGRI